METAVEPDVLIADPFFAIYRAGEGYQLIWRDQGKRQPIPATAHQQVLPFIAGRLCARLWLNAELRWGQSGWFRELMEEGVRFRITRPSSFGWGFYVVDPRYTDLVADGLRALKTREWHILVTGLARTIDQERSCS